MTSGPTSFETSSWHPPSPSLTPQSVDISTFPINGQTTSHFSPSQTQHGWVNSLQPALNQRFHSSKHLDLRNKEFRRPSTTALNSISSQLVAMGSQNYNSHYENIQPTALTTSFIEGFDSASIHDNTYPTAPEATSGSQMQTPPPTRDTSARKKRQQPAVSELQTPPTIRRPISMENVSQGRTTGQFTFADTSPFPFTPFQFSPAQNYGFTPSGPMTAPTQAPTNVFWDPSTQDQHNLNLQASLSFQSFDDQSFNFGLTPISMSDSFSFSSSPFNHRYASSDNFYMPPLTHQHTARPQTAVPAVKRQQPILPSSTQPSPPAINPSVLFNSNLQVRTHEPQRPGATQTRVPYQHQAEALRRERQARLLAPRKDSGIAASIPTTLDENGANIGTSNYARSGDRNSHGLQRSLTDSRISRRARLDPQSLGRPSAVTQSAVADTKVAFIHRKESPLKRQKTNSHIDHPSPPKSTPRRSIVMTVDERGYARAEVVPRQSGKRPDSENSRSASYMGSESDSGDSIKVPPSLPDQTNTGLVPKLSTQSPVGQNNAQAALKEVLENRKRRQKKGDSQPGLRDNVSTSKQPNNSTSSHAIDTSSDTVSYYTDSPTTISDPGFQTFHQAAGEIRCVCGGRMPDHLWMIQCESCKKWLHGTCLELDQFHIPEVFVCVFCSGTPTRRGPLRSPLENT